MTTQPREKPSRNGRHENLPRYDQALRNAKNESKQVKFQLDGETYFTIDEDCTVVGTVNEVDKFDICITTSSDVMPRFVVWIKKSHIVATEIL